VSGKIKPHQLTVVDEYAIHLAMSRTHARAPRGVNVEREISSTVADKMLTASLLGRARPTVAAICRTSYFSHPDEPVVSGEQRQGILFI